MARVSFNDAVEESSSGSEFFKLGNKETARVQFLISDPNDIPTYYTHHIDVDGFSYGKDVQCNMDDYEEGECELCKAGIARKTVAVLLMYDLNDGKVKIWQRSKKFVNDKIIPLLNRYDLKNTVVEIERQGEKLDTSYGLYAMPNLQSEDVSNVEIPDNFDFMLWKKSNEDFRTWLDTGSFPQSDNDGDAGESYTSRRSSESDHFSRRGESSGSRRGGRF